MPFSVADVIVVVENFKDVADIVVVGNRRVVDAVVVVDGPDIVDAIVVDAPFDNVVRQCGRQIGFDERSLPGRAPRSRVSFVGGHLGRRIDIDLKHLGRRVKVGFRLKHLLSLLTFLSGNPVIGSEGGETR